MKENSAEQIFPLSQILDRIRKLENFSGFNDLTRLNSQMFHYIQEIQRYKTTIRFIFQKTLRSFQKESKIIQFARDRWEIFNFAIYRFIYEKKELKYILHNFTDVIGKPEELILIEKFLGRVGHFDWELALKGKDAIEQLSIQHALPSFFIRTLLGTQSLTQIKIQGIAMDEAPRKGSLSFWSVSPLSLSHTQELGLPITVDPHIPNLFHVSVKHKAKLIKSQLFQQGSLIIQEKPSVTAAIILEPAPNDLVLDMCAAPGMKTQFLTNRREHPVKIIANDFHPIRTRTMRQLLHSHPSLHSRSNILNADGYTPPFRSESANFPVLFDRILLDAPCTGSGTFSSHPELKWRQSPGFLRHHIDLQNKLLHAAIRLLKPGGFLVYSTCSLYPQEGEHHFWNANLPLQPCPLPNWILPPYNNLKKDDIAGMGRFFPAEHHTIGFFIAKFQKITIE